MGYLRGVVESGERTVSYNPATGVPLGDVPVARGDEVRAEVARARAAQVGWAALSVEERCQRVRRYAGELTARAEEVVELLVKECGKPRHEALGSELAVVADLVSYFAKHAPRMLATEPIRLHVMKHRRSYLHYAPRGVIGIIAPWNFPFAIPVGQAMMALIAGNGVVVKPSEIAPLVAIKAKELADDCGLPEDLFRVVTGGAETGASLVESGIDYCLFTGSVATGQKVAAACGERLLPNTLELGGKAPAIVCADADLDRAASAITWGAFANAGQVCASVERVYAHQSVHDELVERIVAKTRSLRQGDPSRGVVDVGSMTWERQVQVVDELVRAAVAEGARIEIGGARVEAPGLFYQPTVLTRVRQNMAVMRREIFGPVLPIMRVSTEAEGLELANDSELGLLAYVFTKDRDKGKRLAERIRAGTVMINDVLHTFACPETPWGGVKMSGVGRTHSIIGLRSLCETRHVNCDRIALKRELWWYPYSEKGFRRTLRALRLLFGKS